MAIVRYRDKEGNVQEMLVIKGDSGRGVSNIEINDDGEMVITFTDNTITNVGSVVGPNGDPSEAITIDSLLSLESENPVQNKIITAALNIKADKTYVDEQIGDVETALDNIITLQESLIGGVGE